VYVSGNLEVQRTFDFGNGNTVVTADNRTAMVAKYNSALVSQWVKVAAGGTANYDAVAVDAEGNVYTSGYIGYNGTYNFGDTISAVAPANAYNPVVVKYSATGTALWATTATTSTPDGGDSDLYALTVDGNGNVYAAGYVWGQTTLQFGASVSMVGASASSSNPLVLRLSSSGVVDWARTATIAGAGKDDVLMGITLDDAGHLSVAGYLSGADTWTLGTGVSLTNASATLNRSVLVSYQ